MNVIEQHVELTEDTLTVTIPADWKGRRATLKLVLDEESVEPVPIVKPKTDLTRFRGKWAHLTPEQHEALDQQLTDMRNEWERPIS